MSQSNINLNRIIRLEETRLKDIHSVDSYIEELCWVKTLIDHHINRCVAWNRESTRRRANYGKLDEYLKQLETDEMQTSLGEYADNAGEIQAMGGSRISHYFREGFKYNWPQELEDAENRGR